MGGPFSNSSDSKLPQFSSSASMDNLSLLGRYSYYHNNIDLAESPLLRCLRVGSPDSFRYQALSLAENLEVARSPTIYGTPVKVEEDVLVMDEISVNSALPTGRFARSFTDSGGSTTSSSSSSGGKTLYKTEICRSWEDSGTCRYGPKCQFAHGKDELRPSRFPGKNKIETYKSYSGTGSGTYGPKSRFLYQVMPAVGSQAARVTPQTGSPSNPEESRKNPVSYSAGSDWSPQDDGIEVLLPHSSPENLPSREDVDAYLETILYAPTTKKRLPVFAEICLE